MGKCEVTWDEYETGEWASTSSGARRKQVAGNAVRQVADAVGHPTKPYTDMTLRHGQGRLSGDLHDAVRRQDVLQVALGQDRPLLSPADRGRMGICLPRRHDDGLFVRRRSRRSWATTPGSATTATRSITRSARRSPIPGACTTCTATWPNGASTSTPPTRYKQAGGKTADEPAGGRRPRRIPGGARRLVGRRSEALSQRRAARLEQGLEEAGPADPAEHLVSYRRAFRGFPRRASVADPTAEEAKRTNPIPRSPRNTRPPRVVRIKGRPNKVSAFP